MRHDWLGWFYAKLLPVTNGLYAVVENYFPNDVKYKVRGAITDDLGQRSVFLLLLTAIVELTLYSLFKGTKGAIAYRAEAWDVTEEEELQDAMNSATVDG